MFCLGMSAMLAQIVMTRELMVTFYGNELVIGVVFAAWLLMVSVGSLGIRPFLSRLSENGIRSTIAALLAILAIILPLLIFAARALRIIFNVPMGEYMPFVPMVAGTFLVLTPICILIGIIFPVACRLPASGNEIVSGIYAAESAGSMIAGMAFSFMFVFLLPPAGIALLAAFCALCGAAVITPGATGRTISLAAASGFLILLLFTPAAGITESKAINLRGESFGILPRPGEQTDGKPRLVVSTDSRYQNLTLIKSEDQTTMYGNGRVMFVFPDLISAEQKISFIMAQNPSARKILFIGGNPVDDLPELLKYPLETLTHVELDSEMNRLLNEAGGAEYLRAVSDPRLKQCLMDAPRFVKQAAGKNEKFDIVIVEGPEPTTIALNRFYTVEFYRAISRILAPEGFFYTAVESSEDLQDETASLVASVFKALQAVFPRVLITAGTRNQFFAGQENAPLTFDGKILYERWRSAGIKTKYFRPEYFLNADEISAEKTDFVRHRISSFPVPANTALKPLSAFYNLILWSRYSGSRIERPLHWLKGVKTGWIPGGIGTVFLLVLIFTSVMLKMAKKQGNERPARMVIATVIAVTGFTGMALELILIFIFQTFLGYIYTSIGIVIAMFMLGLALGARAVKKYSGAGPDKCLRILIELDAVLLFIALALPILMKGNFGFSAEWAMTGAIYILTLLTGWADGAQFILSNYLLNRETGGADVYAQKAEISRNAALLNAVDLGGAALGGISIGIIFLPLLGFNGTCYLLAALKIGTILLIGILMCFHTQKTIFSAASDCPP